MCSLLLKMPEVDQIRVLNHKFVLDRGFCLRYQIFEWLDPRTGAGAWSKGYGSLGPAGEAAADTRLLYLRDQPPEMWVVPHAKRLGGQVQRECKDIYEIRFKANGVQQRPLGYFSPGGGVFTIVLWATHKGRQWFRRDFCRIARSRWHAIQKGTAATAEVEID